MEENGDRNWVFDTLTKKPLVTRLFAAMSGSVVTKTGRDSLVTSRGRGKAKANMDDDKENHSTNGDSVRPKKRAKAKAKAGAGRGSGSSTNVFNFSNVPEETSVGETTIRCSLGVRPKVWTDDLLACVNHVCLSIKAMGLQHEVDFEILKADLISIGLRFAFSQEVVLNNGSLTKQYKKWSTLRPALKQYALHKILQEQPLVDGLGLGFFENQ